MMHKHIKMDGWYSKVGRNEQHDIFNFYVKVKIVLHTYKKIKKRENAQGPRNERFSGEARKTSPFIYI